MAFLLAAGSFLPAGSAAAMVDARKPLEDLPIPPD
jgi:hypothetical protein